MYQFFSKNGQLVAFVVGLVITVIFLLFATVLGSGSGTDITIADNNFDFGIGASVALIVVACLLSVFFGVYQVVTDLAGSKKGLIGMLFIFGLFAVCVATSSVETTGHFAEQYKLYGITPGQAKFINGGILTSVILTGVATAAFIFSEIRNFFK